jgi:hypothetical protein
MLIILQVFSFPQYFSRYASGHQRPLFFQIFIFHGRTKVIGPDHEISGMLNKPSETFNSLESRDVVSI